MVLFLEWSSCTSGQRLQQWSCVQTGRLVHSGRDYSSGIVCRMVVLYIRVEIIAMVLFLEWSSCTFGQRLQQWSCVQTGRLVHSGRDYSSGLVSRLVGLYTRVEIIAVVLCLDWSACTLGQRLKQWSCVQTGWLVNSGRDYSSGRVSRLVGLYTLVEIIAMVLCLDWSACTLGQR